MFSYMFENKEIIKKLFLISFKIKNCRKDY